MYRLDEARMMFLTFFVILGCPQVNANSTSCSDCGNSLSGTIDEMVLNIIVQDKGSRNCSVNVDDISNSCSENSKCSSESHEEDNGNSSSNNFKFNNVNGTCSVLLSDNDKKEKVIQFQCYWPKEHVQDDETLNFMVGDKRKCFKKDDGSSSEQRIVVYPSDLVNKKHEGEVPCDPETQTKFEEHVECSFSIFSNARIYEVQRGEEITISCRHSDKRTIYWVAIGNDQKEKNLDFNTTANGIFKYFPKTQSEIDDFTLMCFHGHHPQNFIIGIAVVKHKNAAQNTTSNSRSDGLLHTNMYTREEVTSRTTVPRSMTTTSPSGNTADKRGGKTPGKTQSTSADTSPAATAGITEMNPFSTEQNSRVRWGGNIRKIVIIISVLALTFSISTCLIAVTCRVRGECVSSRPGQDGEKPEETFLSEGEIQTTHLSMRMLPRLPPEQSVIVVEERSPEQNTSPCVCWSPETNLDFPNVKGKCSVADKGPAPELGEETETCQIGNAIEGQSLKFEADCNVSVVSDNIYHTLDDLEEGYEPFCGRSDQEVHSQSTIISNNEGPNSTATWECGPSESEYLETRPQRCFDDLYAKPMKSKKSEVISKDSDTIYSKLRRPAIETCPASILQDKPSRAQTYPNADVPQTCQRMSDVNRPQNSENSEVSLDELFESQDYQLLEHVD